MIPLKKDLNRLYNDFAEPITVNGVAAKGFIGQVTNDSDFTRGDDIQVVTTELVFYTVETYAVDDVVVHEGNTLSLIHI